MNKRYCDGCRWTMSEVTGNPQYCLATGVKQYYLATGVKSPYYGCTRERGHEGDHIACGGGRHKLEVWPQEEPDVPN